ncbi:MAG: MATE family efflux transporter [Terracidiphilus sp.]|jgi:putative MATE family efflux protein
MITRERADVIFKLAFPIGIALSTNMMMSVIDLAMVGKLGTNVTAAVGLSAFSYTLVLAFLNGIAPAVQGLIARLCGENSSEPKCLPLNGGLLLALIVGIPMMAFCYFTTSFFFSAISSDLAVTKVGAPFLRTLYLGLIAAGMLSAFKGHWAGVEKPKVFMVIVLFMNGLNIVLNYALIFGHFGAPRLGATGAAIGTVVSLHVGLIVNYALARFRYKLDGFLVARPTQKLLLRILKLGLPASFEEFFFSIGFVIFLWMMGKVGTVELAVTNVLVRVSGILGILATAMGMASATLVSKSVGKRDLVDAVQWGWDTGILGVLLITLLGVPLSVFAPQFLSLFLTDPQAIADAVMPLRLVASLTGIGSLIYIFGYTLISVGDGKRVVMVSFGTQWGVFLPGVWLVGLHLKLGLMQVWLVYTAYALLATALIVAIWTGGKWKTIKI